MNSTCELGRHSARALKPYPAYKDSRIEWLREVPEHWQARRLKTLCSRSALYGANVAATSYTTAGVRFLRTTDITEDGQLNGRGVFLPRESVDNYLLADGDVLISRSGTIGRSFLYERRIHGPCAYAGYLVRFVPAPIALPKYILLFTKTHAFAGFLRVKAISSTIENVNGEKYANCPLPLPPHSEQAAIVRFLDHADRRIRRYIRAKQLLITLLEEQKQAIIHEAVTGQIDVRTGQAYPAYRDSRVESLGRIPQRWRAVSLGRLTLARCDGPFGSGLKSSHYTDEGIRVVRLQNIGHGTFNDDDAVYIAPEHYATLGDHSVQPGDLLIAGLGDPHHPAGRACVAPTNIRPAMVKADCFRFRLDQEAFLPAFAALQLTATARAASVMLSTGATRQRTNLRSTTRRYVVLPSNSEQARVVESCTAETARLNAVQQVAGREILLMGAYRTRLIADVVTGKLDVREVAAGLPDVDSLAAHDPLDGGNATHDVSDSESEVATSGRDESENSCADERSGPDGHEVRG